MPGHARADRIGCDRSTERRGAGPKRQGHGCIQARIQIAAALDLGIEETRQTLARLEAATWGITLREIEGERFVVLPAGALAYLPRTVGTRPAVKLSNE